MWASAPPDTQITAALPVPFNVEVGCDIMIYNKYTAFHMACRGVRFHAGRRCETKGEDELLDILFEAWIGIHGAPKRLYFDDGGAGLNTENVANIFPVRRVWSNQGHQGNTPESWTGSRPC